jgi:hypothetical protein
MQVQAREICATLQDIVLQTARQHKQFFGFRSNDE